MTERWRQIPKWPSYDVSSLGRVRSSNGILSPGVKPSGYVIVCLYRNGARTTKYLHRLILEAFVGPCPEGMQAHHKNGVRDDNRLENLQWRSRRANVRARGGGWSRRVPTDEEVRQMRWARVRGKSLSAVADEFGIGANAVSQLSTGYRRPEAGGPIVTGRVDQEITVTTGQLQLSFRP